MKALLYSFAACLYAMQAAVICWAVFLINDLPFGALFLVAALIFGIAAFVLGCVNIAFGLMQITTPKKGACKTAMIVKLILVPFFVVNFIIGVLIFAGFVNPFLFLALFIVIPIMIVLTYAAMLVTSSYNVGMMIHKIKSGERTLGELALLLASQFIYFLDVVGSIIIFCRQREDDKKQEDFV